MQRELIRALPSLRTLPESMEAISGQLRAGRLTLRTEHFAGADREVVDRWVSQRLVTFSGGAGALASAGAARRRRRRRTPRTSRQTLWVLGFGGLTFSATLLMRTVAQAMHRLPVRED